MGHASKISVNSKFVCILMLVLLNHSEYAYVMLR